MTTQTTKVKNGIIVLPKELQKTWERTEVFVFPSDDTLIIKKVQKSLEADWQRYEEKLRKGGKKISLKVINEAVNRAKTQS